MIIKFYCYDQATGKCTPVANVDDFAYLRFGRSYTGIGTFDLQLSMRSKYLSRIRYANMIQYGTHRAGLITARQFEDTDDYYGITISGAELKGITAKRVVLPPSGSAYQSYSGAAPEYVVDQLLQQQLLAPTNPNRMIHGSVAVYTPGAAAINYDGRFGGLTEDIVSIAEASQIGWYADIYKRAIKWHLHRGVDRRVSSGGISTVLLASARDNVGQRVLSQMCNVPNTAIVAGQGEGVERVVEIVNDTNTGLERNELFVDARDVDNSADLPQRGLDKLAEESDTAVYSFTLQTSSVDAYFDGKFDLGDICTVRDPEFLPGGDLEARLSEVEEVYEEGVRRVEATIGYDKRKLAAVLTKIRKSTFPLLTT